jgi:hypothetical protein
MIREGVIRIHRDRSDIRGVQLSQRGNQLRSLVVGSVVFRAHDQNRHVLDGQCTGFKTPVVAGRQNFSRHVDVGVTTHSAFIVVEDAMGCGSEFLRGHGKKWDILRWIPGCEQHECGNVRVRGGNTRSRKASIAVANNDEALGIDVEFGNDGGILQERKCRNCVLDAAGLRELSQTTPRASVMKGEYVVSGAAESLRNVQALFIAGGAVKIENGGMVSGPRSRIHYAVHQHARAGNPDSFIARWVCGIPRRIDEDGGRKMAGLVLSQYRNLKGWRRTHHRAPRKQNLSFHRDSQRTTQNSIRLPRRKLRNRCRPRAALIDPQIDNFKNRRRFAEAERLNILSTGQITC